MRQERDKCRTMWEQLHRAQGEDLDARATLKELLGALGLAHFDRATIASALEATRLRDIRIVTERDDAVAAKYQAIRDLLAARETLKVVQSNLRNVRVTIQAERDVADKACAERDEAKSQLEVACAKVRKLDTRLLEVRKAVGERAPSESAKAPPKPSDFQVGDIVARHTRGPGCWGKVIAVDGDYVQVSYPAVGEGMHWHMERELQRKPIEVGDKVRIVDGMYAGRVAKCIWVKGKDASWEFAGNASVGCATSNLIAVTP